MRVKLDVVLVLRHGDFHALRRDAVEFGVPAGEAAAGGIVEANPPGTSILTDEPGFRIPRPGDSGIRSRGSAVGGAGGGEGEKEGGEAEGGHGRRGSGL